MRYLFLPPLYLVALGIVEYTVWILPPVFLAWMAGIAVCVFFREILEARRRDRASMAQPVPPERRVRAADRFIEEVKSKRLD